MRRAPSGSAPPDWGAAAQERVKTASGCCTPTGVAKKWCWKKLNSRGELENTAACPSIARATGNRQEVESDIAHSSKCEGHDKVAASMRHHISKTDSNTFCTLSPESMLSS